MKSFLTRLGFCILLWFTSSASATVINFTAVDLVDTVPGQDLWQYRYTVNGSFVAFGGFNIDFDSARYTSLEDPAPVVNPDWAIVVTQPDAGLGTSGFYNATALTVPPSLADAFVINFVWLGAGQPGGQSFDVFDDTFTVIEAGRTIAPNNNTPVPEPLSPALFACGLIGLGVTRRARKTKTQGMVALSKAPVVG